MDIILKTKHEKFGVFMQGTLQIPWHILCFWEDTRWVVVPSPRSLCRSRTSTWIPAWNSVPWFCGRASCSIRALCVASLTYGSHKQPHSLTCCSQFISKLEFHPQPFPLMFTLQHVGKAAHCSPVSVVYPHHISQCAVTECPQLS